MSTAEAEIRDRLRMWRQPMSVTSAATTPEHVVIQMPTEPVKYSSGLDLLHAIQRPQRKVVYVTTRRLDHRDPFREVLESKLQAAHHIIDRWLADKANP